MRIAIDLRSLSSGNISGVENYTLNLLDRLLAMDKKNQYVLFYNAWKEAVNTDFQFINSQIVKTKWPNKILNLGLKLKIIKLENLIGKFDCLFMPNLNQFNVNDDVKLAITVHDMSPVVTPEFYDIKRRLWHKFLNYKKAFQRANVIFTVSEYTKQDIAKLYNISPDKIKVVYPGIDHKIFRPEIPLSKLREVRNVYGLPGDYILFLNTIEPRKNLINLVKAFDRLNSKADLVIAGRQGWKYRKIFKEIKKSKKFGKIKYVGYLPEEDKAAVIKLAKILVYPSFYEGFGFQPLEAQACGVPTIVSQVTALPEVVKDASLLVNPYNIDDLAKAMELLLTDELLRQKLINKGLERAEEFSWEKAAGGILEELNKI